MTIPLVVWGLVWLVTYPVIHLVAFVSSRPITLDTVVTRVFGAPERRSTIIFIFQSLLPKSATFRWLLWSGYRAFRYAFLLILGYLIAYIARPAVHDALGASGDELHLVSVLFAVGFLIGYILVTTAFIDMMLFQTYGEDDRVWKSFTEQLSPFEGMVRSASEGGDLQTAASDMAEFAFTPPNDTAEQDEEEARQSGLARRSAGSKELISKFRCISSWASKWTRFWPYRRTHRLLKCRVGSAQYHRRILVCSRRLGTEAGAGRSWDTWRYASCPGRANADHSFRNVPLNLIYTART